MDQQQIENTIQFLLENQAKFHSDLELMKEGQQRTDEQIRALTENQQALTKRVDEVVGAVEAQRLEMREAFDNLIVANEVTRKLAEDVARLAIGTSQRVTSLEENSKQ